MMTLQNIIETNIATCENPANRVITECEFYAPNDDTLEIWIRSDYEGWCEDITCIETYHGECVDCCTFVSNDFIGLTEEQARTMINMSFLSPSLCMLAIDEELPF